MRDRARPGDVAGVSFPPHPPHGAAGARGRAARRRKSGRPQRADGARRARSPEPCVRRHGARSRRHANPAAQRHYRARPGATGAGKQRGAPPADPQQHHRRGLRQGHGRPVPVREPAIRASLPLPPGRGGRKDRSRDSPRRDRARISRERPARARAQCRHRVRGDRAAGRRPAYLHLDQISLARRERRCVCRLRHRHRHHRTQALRRGTAGVGGQLSGDFRRRRRLDFRPRHRNRRHRRCQSEGLRHLRLHARGVPAHRSRRARHRRAALYPAGRDGADPTCGRRGGAAHRMARQEQGRQLALARGIR